MKKLSMFFALALFLLISCNSKDENPINNDITGSVLTGGEIIITEFMANPSAVDDTVGEWFEVFNTTNKILDLKNVTLSNGTSQFVIGNSLIIAPGSYLVFSNNSNVNTNGGITVDYLYSNLALTNINGQISIISNSNIIDKIVYSGSTSGKSLSLDPDFFTADGNDGSPNWCLSTSALSSGDFGTPKNINPQCN